MEHWHLIVLGKPSAIYGSLRIEHLPKRSLWGVLASLALDPVTPTRATLTERFWPTVENPAQSLRSGLSILRKTFSPELVTSELRLVEGTTCDLLDLENRLKRAQKLTDRDERRFLLEEAALLVNGHFLDGCESSETFDWVHQTRVIVRLRCVLLLELLLECQQQAGDTLAVTETIQRLLSFDHGNELAQKALLLAAPLQRRLRGRMAWPDVETVLAREDILAFDDRITLDRLLVRQLNQVPPALVPTLLALSIFVTDFNSEQAEAIAGAVPSELARFLDLGLLHTVSEGRLAFYIPIQQVLWRKLTGEQRKRLQERYAFWFMEWVFAQCAKVKDSSWIVWLKPLLTIERCHVERVLEWMYSQNTTNDMAKFYVLIWDFMPDMRNILMEKIHILENALKSEMSDVMKRYCLAAMTMICNMDYRYLKYYFDYLEFVECDIDSIEVSEFMIYLDHSLVLLHNIGNDVLFDKCVERRRGLSLRFPDVPPASTMSHIIAENWMARGRFEEALQMNNQFLLFCQEELNSRLPVGLYQRGCILMGLDDCEKARTCFNQALDGFENERNIHGEAQCLESLAIISHKARRLAEARRLVCQAIELYRQSSDMAAVHAAGGTLGDILRDRGQVTEAFELYQSGLEFWKERDHPRWMAKFQARLTLCGQSNPSC